MAGQFGNIAVFCIHGGPNIVKIIPKSIGGASRMM